MANRPGRGQRVNAVPKPGKTFDIEKARVKIQAQLDTVARDREQARANIEQAQQVLGQAQTALLGCNGAEIAVKQHLADLDALKSDHA